MENRVRRVRLSVRALAGREESSKLLAERFTRDVLDRFCANLDSRFSGQTVLVRRLESRWTLSEAELADPDEVSRCAGELFDSVSVARDGVASEGNQAGVAIIFEDDAAWLASYLRSRSTNENDAWYHARWRGQGLPNLLGSSSGVATGAAALLRLVVDGDLITVLDRLPSSIVSDFVEGSGN